MTVLTVFLGIIVIAFVVVLLLFVSLLDVGFRKVEELHGAEDRRRAERQLFDITSNSFQAMLAEARRRLNQ